MDETYQIRRIAKRAAETGVRLSTPVNGTRSSV
jgi:hypothetical protein